ncbi:MAG: XRE family transcriptional regulator [Candidatus Melainabacteria bacterium HGW-Melainabacteria-1]|nr:MAG: XRE family transcriptional regulator [Candidatus Melainabacteria bacterium HGW-Melainabacteria-1]
MHAEEAAWNKFKHLPADKKVEVIDFIEFLLQKKEAASNPQPKTDWLQWGAGLHREVWQDIDSTVFLEQERDQWD